MNRLSEIRARCEAATPGPWKMSNEPKGSGFFGTIHGKAGISFSGTRADNEFISHARDDISYLLAEVERLNGDYDEANRAYHEWFEEAQKEIARAEKAEAALEAHHA